MHMRDWMGGLLLFMVVTEATRKYMSIQNLSQIQAAELTQMFEMNHVARRLLTPPADLGVQKPLLCQSPGVECLPDEEVRCEIGRHAGCDCDYIRSCFPQASQCTLHNATHMMECGF